MTLHWGRGRGFAHSNRKTQGNGLSLNFLSGTLDSRITFTRGSNATLIDSTGKLTYAPANLLTYSSGTLAQYPTATGNVSNATTPITGFPNSIQFGNNSQGSAVYASFIPIVGVSYILSVYIQMDSGAAPVPSNTTTSGDFGLVVNNNQSSAVPTVVPVSGSIYRAYVLFTASGAGGNMGVIKYTGQSANPFRVTGYQLEPVTYQTTPSTYVATTASAYYGPRFDYDPVTRVPDGLLIEEARTNLLTYSEQVDNAAWTKVAASITANATSAPSGVVAADTLIEGTTASIHCAYQIATRSAGVATYTFSTFFKAFSTNRYIKLQIADGPTTNYSSVFINPVTGTIVGSVTNVGFTAGSATVVPVGNGWYRGIITATTDAVSTQIGGQVYLATTASVDNYTGDGVSGVYVWGAQIELGAFATSYIPTIAATVTRSADAASLTGTNFSSWYNQTEGTWVLGYQTAFTGAAPASAFMIALDSSSTKRHMYVASTAQTFSNFDGTNILSAAQNSTGIVAKSASAYSATEKVIVSLGGSVATGPVVAGYSTGTSVLLPSGGNNFNGHIRQIAYYNTRLPNATLQALTA